MTWVLIIFIARFGGLYNTTPAVGMVTIPGYPTKDDCFEAAEQAKKSDPKPIAWCVKGP